MALRPRKGTAIRVCLVILVVAMFLALFLTVRLENGYGHAWSLAFSPDGRQLMVAYNNEDVRLWDVSQDQPGPQRMRLASDATHAVLPSSVQYAGSRLLIAFRISRSKESPDGYELWDTVSRRRLRVMQLPYRAKIFQASEEGGLILAGSKDAPSSLDLFDMQSGKQIGSLDGGESVPGHLRIHCTMSADGEWVTASFHGQDHGAILKVWSVETRECVKTLSLDSGYDLKLSHDGTLLVDGDRDIWNLKKGQKALSIDRGNHAPSGSAFSVGGRMLALSSYYAGTVDVWNASEGGLLARLNAASTPLDASRRTHVAFSPDGAYLAAATGRTVTVWDTTNFQLKSTLAEGRRLFAAAVFSVAFIAWSVLYGVLLRRWNSPQPEALASGSCLVFVLSVLLGFAATVAIANSALGLFHPGLCSCCTPTSLLLVLGYFGLGTGIFVLTRAIGNQLRDVVPATLLLILFNGFSDFSFLSLTIVVSGSVALVLRGIILAGIPKANAPPTEVS